MSKIIKIPGPMRRFVNNEATMMITSADVNTALLEITTRFPRLKNQLFSDTEELRGFIKIFVNKKDIVSLQKLETLLFDGDVISIVPSFSGG